MRDHDDGPFWMVIAAMSVCGAAVLFMSVDVLASMPAQVAESVAVTNELAAQLFSDISRTLRGQ